MMTDTHTRTHTHAYPWTYMRSNTLTHLGGASFIALPGALHDIPTSSYELEICLMMTHTHSYPRLVALQNTYSSFTFTGAFLLHACGVTRNWRTYFISVRRIFLVETVILQTVLWDIWAWSVHFLVMLSSLDYFSIILNCSEHLVKKHIRVFIVSGFCMHKWRLLYTHIWGGGGVCSFIYLLFYFQWSIRMAAVILCNPNVALFATKGCINNSAISQL